MRYSCKLGMLFGGQLLQLHFFGRLDEVPAGWSLITRVPAGAAGGRA